MDPKGAPGADPDLHIQVVLATDYAVMQETDGTPYNRTGTPQQQDGSNAAGQWVYNTVLDGKSGAINTAAQRLDDLRQADAWMRQHLSPALKAEYLNRRKEVKVTLDPTKTGPRIRVRTRSTCFATAPRVR